MAPGPLLQLHGISKAYGGVRALEDLTWEVAPGEVHALCGENGAGKSTLIKILTGVVQPDSGQIYVAGQQLAGGSVTAAERAGIAVIHQESVAFPDLNAVDNLFVGRELRTWRGWRLDWPAMRRETARILASLGEEWDVHRPLAELTLAQRQMVALARAVQRESRLLILDEPTASLSARETAVLFRLVRQWRARGASVVYVSHRLEEIFALADRVTVLRDGRLVETRAAAALDRETLIRAMVGRSPATKGAGSQREGMLASSPGSASRPKVTTEPTPVLQVESLTRKRRFEAISFSVGAGEIVGLAGLVGAGRSEVARAIFGIDPYDSGRVLVQGRPLTQRSVAASLRAGLALVPEDRQHEGLLLPWSVLANTSVVVLRRLHRCGWLPRRREADLVTDRLRRLQVKYPHLSAAAATLSGGNQQKVVLAKWLASDPRLLMLDEPTRGVDVGAKEQVHQLIRELAASGMATLLISSDLPELLALSHRVLVLREGRLVAELSGDQLTEDQVLEAALPDGRDREPDTHG